MIQMYLLLCTTGLWALRTLAGSRDDLHPGMLTPLRPGQTGKGDANPGLSSGGLCQLRQLSKQTKKLLFRPPGRLCQAVNYHCVCFESQGNVVSSPGACLEDGVCPKGCPLHYCVDGKQRETVVNTSLSVPVSAGLDTTVTGGPRPAGHHFRKAREAPEGGPGAPGLTQRLPGSLAGLGAGRCALPGWVRSGGGAGRSHTLRRWGRSPRRPSWGWEAEPRGRCLCLAAISSCPVPTWRTISRPARRGSRMAPGTLLLELARDGARGSGHYSPLPKHC